MTGGLNSTWLPQGKEMPVLFLLYPGLVRRWSRWRQPVSVRQQADFA